MSITSSRPLSSTLTLVHTALSSATQGAISFPSRTSRRWVRVSVMEIFNILVFPFDKGKGNMHAKVQQLQVTQTQGVEEEPETAVSIVSKSISTLEDDSGRFRRDRFNCRNNEYEEF